MNQWLKKTKKARKKKAIAIISRFHLLFLPLNSFKAAPPARKYAPIVISSYTLEFPLLKAYNGKKRPGVCDMKQLKSPVLTMIGTALLSFIRILPPLLFFEIIYKLLCTLIFSPLLSAIMQGALSLSGYEVAFNNEIAGFYTTIPGIISAIVICVLAGFLAYFEYAVLILMIYYRYTGNPVSLADSMKMALTTFKSLARPWLYWFSLLFVGAASFD